MANELYMFFGPNPIQLSRSSVTIMQPNIPLTLESLHDRLPIEEYNVCSIGMAESALERLTELDLLPYNVWFKDVCCLGSFLHHN